MRAEGAIGTTGSECGGSGIHHPRHRRAVAGHGKGRDAEKAASFWSDDASIFPPNAAPVIGKQAIRSYVAGAFASPDFSIDWKTDKVVVAASGEMAYSTGSDVFTFRHPDHKLVTGHTERRRGCKKQANGSWKAAIESGTLTAPHHPHCVSSSASKISVLNLVAQLRCGFSVARWKLVSLNFVIFPLGWFLM